jgi:hypothetical protein
MWLWNSYTLQTRKMAPLREPKKHSVLGLYVIPSRDISIISWIFAHKSADGILLSTLIKTLFRTDV